jgi:hypothetical protein
LLRVVKPFVFHIILLEVGLDALLQVRENGPELVVAFLKTAWSIIMLFKVFALIFW